MAYPEYRPRKILAATVEIEFGDLDEGFEEDLTDENILYQFENYTGFYLRSARVVGEPTVREV